MRLKLADDLRPQYDSNDNKTRRRNYREKNVLVPNAFKILC